MQTNMYNTYIVRYVSTSGSGEEIVRARNSNEAKQKVESMHGFGSTRSIREENY